MDKRQDIFIQLSNTMTVLIMSLSLLMGLAACQTESAPRSIELSQPVDIHTTDTPATQRPTTPTPPAQAIGATPTVDCLSQSGQVQSELFYSEHLGVDLPYWVYLPPCYHSHTRQRYPVVYLLHGLYFDEDQWLRIGVAEQMDRLIAEEIITPFILILPQEARFDPPQISAFADALVFDLIPRVDQQYRTRNDKPYRAIGGLSRGAAWSVRIGLDHYQLFDSIGAHSLPLFEADGGRLTAWLSQIPPEELPCFYIDIGRGDPERRTAQAFADQLNEHNVPHTWYLFNGSHTEGYWSAHLEGYLRWYGRDW